MTLVEKPGAGTIAAAILLPPLAVFLARGLAWEFWVSVVLTVIAWLPGVAFALVTLFRPELVSRRA